MKERCTGDPSCVLGTESLQTERSECTEVDGNAVKLICISLEEWSLGTLVLYNRI